MTAERLGVAMSDFLPRIPGMIAECDKVGLPRERTQMIKAIQNLGEFINATAYLKSHAVEASNEEAANLLGANEFLLLSVLGELWSWVALKDHDYWNAHDALVEAQQDLEVAMRFLDDDTLQERAERLETRYQVLFPSQMYMSPGIAHRAEECTICGQDAAECAHVPGRMYMGRLCGVRALDPALVEGSIVSSPKDRRCLVQKFTSEGRWVDRLTYEDLGASGHPVEEMHTGGPLLVTGRTTEALHAREAARLRRIEKVHSKKNKKRKK